MTDEELIELVIKVNKLLIEILETLSNHKQAIELIHQRMDAIDGVLFSHKESLEYLDRIVNEPYNVVHKGKKVYTQ